MKKRIAIVIAALAVAGVLATAVFLKFNREKMQVEPEEVHLITVELDPLASSPETLKSRNDVIVVATLDTSKNILFEPDKAGDIYGYQDTKIKVEKVIKGDVKPGECLPVVQQYYTTEGGKELWTYNGYLPMKKGTQYLLFLKMSSQAEGSYAGKYLLYDLEYSKYVLDENRDITLIDENDRDFLEIGEATNIEEYLSWYREILEEYKDKGTLEVNDLFHSTNEDSADG